MQTDLKTLVQGASLGHLGIWPSAAAITALASLSCFLARLPQRPIAS